MVGTIAPVGFVGQEAVMLPRPARLPVIEEAAAREGAWLFAFQTVGTVPPPARRAR